MSKIKYFIQKLLAIALGQPITSFRGGGKSIGYSLVGSEFANSNVGKNTNIVAPYFMHSVTLGDYSYIAKNSSIANCSIGKFCSIGPNFCCGLGLHPTNGISTHPMFYSTAKQNGMTLVEKNTFEETKQTTIGNDVFIGANVTILDGVTIGDGAVIGAGAVVTKNIPPYAVAVGVPAEVKKYRFSKAKIDQLLKFQWWNWDEERLKVIAEKEFDGEIEDFGNKFA